MGLATFIGGIHPYEGKELSENKPVQVLMPKGDLVYPMSQHIDVYKRQVLKPKSCMWAAGLSGAAWAAVHAVSLENVSMVMIRSCLLYTSRCV